MRRTNMTRWVWSIAVLWTATACGTDDTEFSDTTSQATSSTSSASGGAGGTGSASGGSGQGGFDPAQDPVVQINHPGDMECRHPGIAFPCSGTAVDPQDG